VITKLDVLSGFEKLAIVTGYRSSGKTVGFEAASATDLELEYAWYDGWSEDVSGIRRIADLPAAARIYVAALEGALGVPIDAVSLGPERRALAVP
jgi:adenylosuccinate synthase